MNKTEVLPSQKMTNLCIASVLFKDSLSEVPDDRKSPGLRYEIEQLDLALQASNCLDVLTHARRIKDACAIWDPPPAGFSLRVFRVFQLALAEYAAPSEDFTAEDFEENRKLLWSYLETSCQKS